MRSPGACRHRGVSSGNADVKPAIYCLAPHRSMPAYAPRIEERTIILTTYHNPPTAMSAGSRSMAHLSHLTIPSDPADALVFARYHDRRADLLLSEGCIIQAEAAAQLAFEARARALGMPA